MARKNTDWQPADWNYFTPCLAPSLNSVSGFCRRWADLLYFTHAHTSISHYSCQTALQRDTSQKGPQNQHSPFSSLVRHIFVHASVKKHAQWEARHGYSSLTLSITGQSKESLSSVKVICQDILQRIRNFTCLDRLQAENDTVALNTVACFHCLPGF